MNRRITLMAIAGAFSLFSGHTLAESGADAANGVWLNGTGEGFIQVFESDGKYHGDIVGAPPESARRSESGKSMLGTRILSNFKYDGEGEWNEGTVTDPDNDKQYTSKMWLVDQNTLKIRGFLGIALLGRTVVWTRVPKDAPGVEQNQLK